MQQVRRENWGSARKRSLGQSNVLHRCFILFTGEGLCPWSHVPSRSLCQQGVSVQRGLYLAISVQEFSVQDRVSVRRGSLSGGGLCPRRARESLLGRSMSGGGLSWGVSVRRRSLSGPPPPHGGRSGGMHLSRMLSSVKTILHYCYRSLQK